MVGLIEQLQADALDPSVAADTMLRKVKVAATKLGLDDALEWVTFELSGYPNKESIPDYRRGHGEPLAWHPYHGWQPLRFDGPLGETVSNVYFDEPIGSYETLLKGETANLILPIPSAGVAELNKLLNIPVSRMARSIAPGAIIAVVQRVRDLVLDWSLELSRAGITGEGISFTVNERAKAALAPISIGTFNGSFNTGDAIGDGAKIKQTTELSGNFQSEIANLEHTITTQVVDDDVRREMLDALQAMKSSKDKPSLMAGYERLLSAGANHMTILAPFLPALGQMLVG